MENNLTTEEIFTEEERRNVVNLGNVLRSIHDRLAREGYFLLDGKTWNIFKCAKPISEVEIEIEN